ncbi:MAG: hypothetical protein GXX04_02310 [Clostridiaceae bacterium]|nr:hypothetical protein [Clostridiaceae bacterium]
MKLEPRIKRRIITGALGFLIIAAIVIGLILTASDNGKDAFDNDQNAVKTGNGIGPSETATSGGQDLTGAAGGEQSPAAQDDGEKPGVPTLRIYTVDREIGRIIDLYAQKHWDFEYELDIYNDEFVFGPDDIVRMVREEFDKNGGTDVDLYILPASQMDEFVKGEYSKYACTYKELGIDVEKALAEADIPECIVEDGSNPDGELIALHYQPETVLFLYRRSVAKEVWGTDDPDRIAEIIGSGTEKWDKFTEAAETLRDHGYFIVPGYRDLAYMMDASPAYNPGPKEAFEPDPRWIEFMDMSKSYLEKGYIKQTRAWSYEWSRDLWGENDRIFGVLFPTDVFQYLLYDTAGDWAVCVPPFNIRMHSNTGIMVSKNSPHKELLGHLVEWITLDSSENGFQYSLATNTHGISKFDFEKFSVISGTVMKKVDGGRAFLGGQNINPMVYNALKETKGLRIEDLINYDLFNGFLDAMEYYLDDEKDRDTAISDCVREVRETGEVKRRPGDPSLDGTVILKDETFRNAVRDALGITRYSLEMSKYDMAEVTELDLSGYDIENIEEIVYFKNLAKLNLSNNRISDISLLKELKKLRELDLSGNMISDISPLGGMKYMRKLCLSENRISDISVLKGMPILDVLDLSGNDISDISSLEGLKDLKELDLSNNMISNISIIRNLPNLKSLNLAGNQVKDRSPAKHVADVKWD